MDKRLLHILCCPVTKSAVTPLNRTQLETLNAAIARGDVRDAADGAIREPLQAGLITVDGKRIYRIEDDIPVMLAEEAIATTQFDFFPGLG